LLRHAESADGWGNILRAFAPADRRCAGSFYTDPGNCCLGEGAAFLAALVQCDCRWRSAGAGDSGGPGGNPVAALLVAGPARLFRADCFCGSLEYRHVYEQMVGQRAGTIGGTGLSLAPF